MRWLFGLDTVLLCPVGSEKVKESLPVRSGRERKDPSTDSTQSRFRMWNFGIQLVSVSRPRVVGFPVVVESLRHLL